jgi:TPR repeat protein
MKTKSLEWTLFFVLMLQIIPLFGQAQETNHVADKFDPVQSGAVPLNEATNPDVLRAQQALQVQSGAVPVAEATPQFEATKAKAEKGNAQAQYNLGNCYLVGQGVVKDEVEAVKWYRIAADQNYVLAEDNLGICYAMGLGVAQDDVEALKWWRKAAEQNCGDAQLSLGVCYDLGRGVTQDYVQAYKWYNLAVAQGDTNAIGARRRIATLMTPDQIAEGQRLSAEFTPKKETLGSSSGFEATRAKAETGDAQAQYNLGVCYDQGQGVAQDHTEAVMLYRKAADQGLAEAQNELGLCYISTGEGLGVARGFVEAVKWFREAANQGYAEAQCNLGRCYLFGRGVSQDYLQAYEWFNLAAAQGNTNASMFLPAIALRLSPETIAEAERSSREYAPRKQGEREMPDFPSTGADTAPNASGTGFFITDDGYLISNNHVVKDATKVRLLTSAGLIDAKVVQVDAANDLALLKTEGKFSSLPISSSRSAQLGGTVATIGFPDIGLQGFAPKLAKGEIASLSGAADDPRYFQISVPVQPGNSGGALVDDRGNVIGIVSAKLDASVALAASGSLPENVNYAVKSSLLLSFLESVPAVSAKLKAPNTADEKFSDVVKSAKDAAVLVLVY